MPLYLVEAPSEAALSLAEAKEHLRVQHDDEDAYISSLVSAVQQLLDGRDGELQRALVSQRWELRQDGFGRRDVEIPLPPLIEVESVQYYDTDDVLQTVSNTVYQVVGVGGHNPARVSLKDGQSWPTVGDRREAVVITFRAGYGDVPEPIKAATKLKIGTLYQNRESVVLGVSVLSLTRVEDRLVDNYRVRYFA